MFQSRHAATRRDVGRGPRPRCRILVGTLVTAALVGLPHEAVGQASCWRTIGERTLFGSADQAAELKRLAPATTCPALAITWTIRPMPARSSVLVWDVRRQTLTRIHVDREPPSLTGTRWEEWTGVTKASIAATSPDNGFDFASYTQGKGRVPLSPDAVALLRRYGNGAFRGAL